MLAGRSSTDRKNSAGGPKGDSADAISSSIVGRSRFPSAPSWQHHRHWCQNVQLTASTGCSLRPYRDLAQGFTAAVQ